VSTVIRPTWPGTLEERISRAAFGRRPEPVPPLVEVEAEPGPAVANDGEAIDTVVRARPTAPLHDRITAAALRSIPPRSRGTATPHLDPDAPVPYVAAPPREPQPIAPIGDPRVALCVALGDRAGAATRVDDARAALDRAVAHLAETDAALRDRAAADEADIAETADRLQGWLANPVGDRPAPNPTAPTLRSDTSAARAAAVLARDSLARDLDAATTDLERVELRVDGALLAIIGTEVGDLADRLCALERAAAALRGRLSDAGAAWVGQPGRMPHPLPLSNETKVLLRDPPANTRIATDGGTIERRRWVAFARRLLADPEARLDD
jgi:hypothetical protein